VSVCVRVCVCLCVCVCVCLCVHIQQDLADRQGLVQSKLEIRIYIHTHREEVRGFNVYRTGRWSRPRAVEAVQESMHCGVEVTEFSNNSVPINNNTHTNTRTWQIVEASCSRSSRSTCVWKRGKS
jgi:hypothetical protein